MSEIIAYIFTFIIFAGPLFIIPIYFLLKKEKTLSLIILIANLAFGYWWISGYFEVMPENEAGVVIVGMLFSVPVIALFLDFLIIRVYRSIQRNYS